MTQKSGERRNWILAALWVIAAVVVLAFAWAVPVNLKSITPALLKSAGEGTPGVAEFGLLKLESEKLGSAQMIALAATELKDPKLNELDERIRRVSEQRPEWVPWGGWDPFLDPIFNLKDNQGRSESTPVLNFFVTQKGRESLRAYLSNSRSIGVQTVLGTAKVEGTTQFVPAGRSGGQALDSTILLTAVLYQSDNFSPELRREITALAEQAVASKQMGRLETFYLDLLSLGKRLNWVQLSELMKTAKSVAAVSEIAHLARVAQEDLAIIFTAALQAGSSESVGRYLIEHGKVGLADLRVALGYGQGAVKVLLDHQLPLNHGANIELNEISQFALLNPRAALVAKYIAFILGAFLALRALESIFGTNTGGRLFRPQVGALAVLLGGLLIVASEPFLLRKELLSEFRVRFSIPALDLSNAATTPPAENSNVLHMESSTILSIAFFALLQVVMYLVCLRKIREIANQNASAATKLRLMENEENLFDGGLYIGIGGTATALVLQVLKVIEPNLLAAYSSNLFGITCVALVKIRSVRPYKRALIIESTAAQPVPVLAKTSV